MKPLEKLNLGTLVGTISEDIVRINLELYQLKINELVEAVNELENTVNQLIAQKDPEYKVPLSGDPEYNKKVSDLEKEKTIQDLHNLENEQEKPKKDSVFELIRESTDINFRFSPDHNKLVIGVFYGKSIYLSKKQACQLLDKISVLVNQMKEEKKEGEDNPDLHAGTHRTSRWENRKKR